MRGCNEIRIESGHSNDLSTGKECPSTLIKMLTDGSVVAEAVITDEMSRTLCDHLQKARIGWPIELGFRWGPGGPPDAPSE